MRLSTRSRLLSTVIRITGIVAVLVAYVTAILRWPGSDGHSRLEEFQSI